MTSNEQHPWYQISAAGQGPVDVLIFGDIGESFWGEESVTAKAFVTDLAKIDSKAPLNVRINSYGGAVADGVAIYNAIRRHKGAVTTFNEGVAVSIASLIFMAGEKREMASNAMFMMHAPWGLVQGNANDMRSMAETLDRIAEAMVPPYTRSGMSADEVMAILKDGTDHWFTASEAADMGIATEISDPLDVAAQYRDNRFTAGKDPANQIPQQADISSNQRKPEMTKSTLTAPDTAPEIAATAAPVAVDVAQIEAAARKAERARMAERAGEIRAMFKPFMSRDGMSDFMSQMIEDAELDQAQVSAKLLAKLGEGSEPVGRDPHIQSGETHQEKFAKGAVLSIRARAGLGDFDPSNEWNGRSLVEIARACLEARGIKAGGMRKDDLAKKVLSRMTWASGGMGQTTSDFDVLLENVMHKTLIDAFAATPDTWSKICRVGSVSDFRAWLRIIPGSIGNIDVVGERGEYTYKSIPDAKKESISAVRRGNLLSVTPEILVNDDVGFFSAVPEMFGRAAKRTIEGAFYSLLTSNAKAGPTLTETSAALFSSTHGNLVTSGAAPSVSTISAAKYAMAAQTDPSGNEILDISPSIFLGTHTLADAARVVNNSQYDPDTANKLQRFNQAAGTFSEIIGTARLTGTNWYCFASPTVMPTFEVVFLDGQSAPKLSSEEDFQTAGLVWRVELPFGVGCIGWRGAYQNDGA